MSGHGQPFAPHVASLLRNAARAILHVPSGHHRKLYNTWRVTMASIAPVDAFYVAFFRDDQFLVFPYLYDGEEYEPPGFQMYGPSGISAWIRRNATPYLYKMDDGRLLHTGHSFGQEEKLSRDAITIPLFESSADGSTVIGVASMQTYQADVYDEDIARAFQWLSVSVVTVLAREREDHAYQAALLPAGEVPVETPITIVEVIEECAHRMAQLRLKIDASLRDESLTADALRQALRELLEMCHGAEADLTDLLMQPSVDAKALLARLTSREREIARLVAEGLTNDQIADRLAISEPTVKTHVTRILKKFGVRQRSAVAAKLRPFA